MYAPHTKGKLRKVCGAWVAHPLDVAFHIASVDARQVIPLDTGCYLLALPIFSANIAKGTTDPRVEFYLPK